MKLLWKLLLPALSLSVLLSLYGGCGRGLSEDQSDAERLNEEMARFLSLYLAINTTNPPGNEDKACFFLKTLLTRKGIPSQIIVSPKGGYNLVSVYKGNGKKRPVILLNNTDVVPALESAWKHPPFGAKTQDGYIYGRGALDMKTMAILELYAFSNIYNSALELERDIVFLSVADSKSQGKEGLSWIIKNGILEGMLNSKPEYVLGGGFFGVLDILGRKKPTFFIENAQKATASVEIKIPVSFPKNIEGYSDIALNRISKILGIINSPSDDFFPDGEGLGFLKNLSLTENPLKRLLLHNSNNRLVWRMIRNQIYADPIVYGQLDSSVYISGIVLETGRDVDNLVLSGEVALKKGSDLEVFLSSLKKKLGIDDISYRIENALPYSESPKDGELYLALKKSIETNHKGAGVSPFSSFHENDLRHYRDQGVMAYGITPIVIDKSAVSSIGNKNERVPRNGLAAGMKTILDALLALGGLK